VRLGPVAPREPGAAAQHARALGMLEHRSYVIRPERWFKAVLPRWVQPPAAAASEDPAGHGGGGWPNGLAMRSRPSDESCWAARPPLCQSFFGSSERIPAGVTRCVLIIARYLSSPAGGSRLAAVWPSCCWAHNYQNSLVYAVTFYPCTSGFAASIPIATWPAWSCPCLRQFTRYCREAAPFRCVCWTAHAHRG